MATAAECINGKCDCAKAANCSFARCKNCDWPVDQHGKTVVDHSCDEWETCPECGGPATDNMRRVYGALAD